MNKLVRIVAAAAAGLALGFQAMALEVDPQLPSYVKAENVSGNLNSIGSDTLNNLMTFWAEGFRALYPNVNIQIEGKGSSTAPAALIGGTAQLGPMSRMMKSTEIDEFEKKYGFKPTPIGVALDSLAVFVHKDNPLKSLSFEQVDAIFSSTRKGGARADIVSWSEVGLEGPLAIKPMSLYGRNSASGTYAFFKEHALFGGDFKATVKEQPGSASVVMGVGNDVAGIGYSGIGYTTSDVKPIALSKSEKDEAYEPVYENVLSGKYPLSRVLYVYIVKAPGKPLDPMVREFLTYAVSKEGQEVVIKDGYLPLPLKLVEKQLENLK
ncbi:MAG: phosphate ABC transporter substrate-binding protein [Candidatus Hydrogenedentes bacterium]|nr:phosphate ABC transporter substrate-binding protein [Candidatus Hydrogenedentota bacterium]